MGTEIMQDTIMDSLDDLCSSRTSMARKGRALDSLEKLLAEICGSPIPESYLLKYFTALQDTFQCNIPSRLLAWISETTFRLEDLSTKGSLDAERESEAQTLSSQLVQGLSIIQGIALQHPSSKRFLGRRYAQNTLLDLLLVSRHVAPIPPKTAANATLSTRQDQSGTKNMRSSDISLTSIALDTLLCVLVDSSSALRMFEEASGVQYVVRILKRAGTPREVRMKCLEFLYFYLMDETSPPSPAVLEESDRISTAPNSPVKASSRSTTLSSISCDRSSSSSFSTDSGSLSFSTSTDATSFSTSSFSGTSTPKESSSPAGTARSTLFQPIKISSRIVTPRHAVTPRSLMMLKKDVDFIPMSPKKASVTKLGLGIPRIPSKQREVMSSEDVTDTDDVNNVSAPAERPTHSSLSPFDIRSPEKPNTSSNYRPGHRRGQSSMDLPEVVPVRPPRPSVLRPVGARTMEEKKEILGRLLGNVEALVEGVRKAGVWGLG